MQRKRYHYLMIKYNKQTKLKYLCRKLAHNDTEAINYLGSGIRWMSDIKAHGKDKVEHISILYKCEEDKIEEFKEIALKTSHELDVVDSNDWANIIHEDGSTDRCGSTSETNVTKGLIWIFKGDTRMRIKPTNLEVYINDGWCKGYPQSFLIKMSNSLKGKPAHNKGKQTKPLSEYKSERMKRFYRRKLGIVPPQNDTERRRKTSKDCLNRPEVLAKFKLPKGKPKTAINEQGQIETLSWRQWKRKYNVNPSTLAKGGVSRGWRLYIKDESAPAGI